MMLNTVKDAFLWKVCISSFFINLVLVCILFFSRLSIRLAYLFLYNLLQFCGHTWIFANMTARFLTFGGGKLSRSESKQQNWIV
jgi:hypothetical protein